MPCCSACHHFTQYTGTTCGVCTHPDHPGETFTFNHACADGFQRKRKAEVP